MSGNTLKKCFVLDMSSSPTEKTFGFFAR